MIVQVIGIPASGTTARVGERFRLREGQPLRIGTASDARIRVTAPATTELRILHAPSGTGVELEASGVRVSICGVNVAAGSSAVVHDGDCLFIDEALVLQFLNDAPKPPPRNLEFERTIAGQDDNADGWRVYLDFLEEQGDPLLSWVRSPHEPEARLRRLGGLGEAVVAGEVLPTWNQYGFVTSVRILRAASRRPGRLAWLIGQAGRLPVARLLSSLHVELFSGGTVNDVEAVSALNALSGCDFVTSLREVSLGFVGAGGAWPQTDEAWLQLQRVAPYLQGSWATVVSAGLRARLKLEAWTPTASAAWSDVVLNPQRTEVGGGAECLARLVGDVPRLACSLHRTVEGEWVVHDERADPFHSGGGRYALRVNGVPVARAVLKPGDVVEPVEGVRLRFELVSG
ncbi:MAG: hypothetical protein DI536_15565 [Archangium gephyra]|uniref:FHA domain-containing protein n=1 Tax=Archangium gephyra TaxID=48 RepID=A0A2W5T9Z8_9BACT|nr:MAG: hypothetical protein DI536_15565 [Archangium gephyra]